MFTASESRPNPGTLPAPATDSNPEVRLAGGRSHNGLKMAIDGVAAGLLLIVTAPLLVLAMFLVKITSRGPALYCQIRLGRHGKPFTIFKIRTMGHECESLTGACWSAPGDVRVTPVGRWLRKTHIDELPQLWNVLRGDMSLVGPRPERPEFVPHLEKAIPHYRGRLLVRPGVTGLAQVQLPPDTDLGSVRCKLAYDLHYVQNLGIWFDIRICWATVLKMAGVPYRSIRWIFAFPTRETIDNGYSKLLVNDRSQEPGKTSQKSASPGLATPCLLTPNS